MTEDCRKAWKFKYQNLVFSHLLSSRQFSQLVSIIRPFSREFCEYEQIYKMIKIWRQFSIFPWYDRSVSFPNCNRKWRITNKKCSWQEFERYLVLVLAIFMHLDNIIFQICFLKIYSFKIDFTKYFIRHFFALRPTLGRLSGRVPFIRCWWLSCKKLYRNSIAS